ncbi:hypothetical protein DNF23_51285 [Pseudomonas syringae pv. pisi]
MINKLKAQDFRPMEVDMESLVETISTGKALLFVGSGFARNAIALDNHELPTAEGLANAIGALGEFDADKDLRYASEKFMREDDPEKLVEFLRNAFTIKKSLAHQQVISAAPWRRIYTTNYDMCVEESAKESGKRIDAVDLGDPPSEFLARKNICVHLNGSLKNLSVESLSSHFKLSTSSYLSADSFLESAWHYPFKRDLEMCSAIVFVGYSLYDIEIQKILYQNDELAAKTFFVTSPTIKERERFTIAPFGYCVPIGAEGFAQHLVEKLPSYLSEANAQGIVSLAEYKISEGDSIPRDADAEKFLLFGDIRESNLERGLSSNEGAPIVIRRADLNKALESALSGQHVAVLSDFGNGKSIFLRSLAFLLAQKGHPVYIVDNVDSYNHQDLEILERTGKKTFLFIDSYDQQLDLLRHFGDLQPRNIVLILATRSPRHERHRETINRFGLVVDEFVIDELEDSEIDKFVEIVENIGLWEEGRVTQAHNEKRNHIKNKHKSQLQQTLLSILQAPQMVTRVNDIVQDLWKKKGFKDTVFAISVLSALDFPLKPSMVSEVAGNDEIYNSALRSNESFSNLFRISKGEIQSRSSLFSLALIRNHFHPTYVVDEILAIAKRMDSQASQNNLHKLVLKAILRFSGIESLFPERQKINNLVRYYEEVKRRLPWLKNDPHYWLQYGMALLAYDEYTKSQRMIDLAYEWAEKKRNYHTVHIDMVQSRLYMEMATKEKVSAESYKLFSKAMSVLKHVPDDDAKFRYLERVGALFSSAFEGYSKSNKIDFVKTCEVLSRDTQAHIDRTQPKGSSERRLVAIRQKLDEIAFRGKEIISLSMATK